MKIALFSKTKNVMRKVLLFYIFTKLFSVWLFSRYLDSCICFTIQSIVMYSFS